MGRKEPGGDAPPPAFPVPSLLSLDEAANLLALGHVEAVGLAPDWLSDDQRQTLDQARRELIRALRSGRIMAQGKRSYEQKRHNETGEWYYLDGHRDRDWSIISAACFDENKVDWVNCSINSREFTDIVLDYSSITGLTLISPKLPAVAYDKGIGEQTENQAPTGKRRGAPKKYEEAPIIAMAAAIIAVQGEPDSEEEFMRWIEESYEAVYGPDTAPSRTWLQQNVVKPAMVGASDFTRAQEAMKRATSK